MGRQADTLVDDFFSNTSNKRRDKIVWGKFWASNGISIEEQSLAHHVAVHLYFASLTGIACEATPIPLRDHGRPSRHPGHSQDRECESLGTLNLSLNLLSLAHADREA